MEQKRNIVRGGPLDLCLVSRTDWASDSELAGAWARLDAENLSASKTRGFESRRGRGRGHEEGFCLEVFEVEAEVVKGIAGVEGGRSCRTRNAEKGRSHFRAIGKNDGDAILRADREAAKMTGVGLSLRPEAGVIEALAAGGKQGRRLWGEMARPGKNLRCRVHLLEWAGQF